MYPQVRFLSPGARSDGLNYLSTPLEGQQGHDQCWQGEAADGWLPGATSTRSALQRNPRPEERQWSVALENELLRAQSGQRLDFLYCSRDCCDGYIRCLPFTGLQLNVLTTLSISFVPLRSLR